MAKAGKNIILLSDGTGNSASALAKTNVWRLYQALDLAPDDQGNVRQVAFYDNGVGTSSFKPLAILGGAFGWGLKRNILDLYRFLCLNYEKGDRIYAFGFSRGAFTIRTLVALVISQGVVRFTTEAAFRRAIADTYRAYRADLDNSTGSFLVRLMRHVRNGVISTWRTLRGQANEPRPMLEAKGAAMVHFVGVWDTVAAYGLPMAELTSGIDQVVWPLSMPNYKLHENVRTARHALALDDERDAFHPLLWDEVHESELSTRDPTRKGRLQQVWFAGMHADVGGGYANDGMAMIPLVWMLREASNADLQFIPARVAEYEAAQDLSAPMHDSRRGLAGYYRYQPRRIDAWLAQETTASLLMRNPLERHRALLQEVQVHHSVIDRIQNGGDHYAPIVLPRQFTVIDGPGAAIPASVTRFASHSDEERENVWNDVWRKRFNYFLLVAFSTLLAAFPLFPASYEEKWDEDTLSFLSPLILTAGSFLPSMLESWVRAFARGPDLFVPLVIIITLLIARGATLQAIIRDRMRGIWAGAPGATPRRRITARMTDSLIRGLRTCRGYQSLFRTLKWRLLPLVFGYIILALVFVIPIWGAYVARLSSAEASGTINDIRPMAVDALPTVFSTRDPYWDTGQVVQTGRRYRVTMTVETPWKDGNSVNATPEGFWTSEFPIWLRWAVLIRRSGDGKWFQPFITIIPDNGQPRLSLPLNMRRVGATSSPVFEATFEAPKTGRVRLWVNDTVIGAAGLSGTYYANNSGTARVTFSEETWMDQRPR